MNDEIRREIEVTYKASMNLWMATQPPQQEECGPLGCPGVAGPSSKDYNWTLEQGTLDGTISALQDVRKRLFG